MRATRQTTPYEVLCPRCNVTFPVGAKQCVHCGGRLGRHAGPAPQLMGPNREMTAESFPSAEAAEAEEEAAPRRSPFSPVALLWVLVFVGGTIYRACTEG